MAKVNAIRGMNDVLPIDTPTWRYLEDIAMDTLSAFGYQEIRFPIVEQTDLFKRSIGEVTDIVEKEMYTFEDRNGESITLRPEGTASCVRAAEQHGLLFNQQQRLWYGGPMFRYERPQKGRYRQFHQIGVEAFGMPGPDIDAELILLSAAMLEQFGLANSVELQLNSLGTQDSRAAYREVLVEFLGDNRDQLDADSQRRLEKNPLRILDSKNPDTQALLADAPLFSDYLDEESSQHLARLCELLEAAGISYQINPRLVRGLDYYSKTVFEWVTESLGAQGAVCAGGRYDGLVEQLGGRSTPAVGFAMGIERLVLLVQTLRCFPEDINLACDVYVAAMGEAAETRALTLSQQLREQLPGLRFMLNCGGGSFKSQLKRADKSGAQVALIWGDEELAQGVVTIKELRTNNEQAVVPENELVNCLHKFVWS